MVSRDIYEQGTASFNGSTHLTGRNEANAAAAPESPIATAAGPLPSASNSSSQGSITPPSDPQAAAKRRQNTIAARKSRERKTRYVNELEDQVEGLSRERDVLKAAVASLEERVVLMSEVLYPDRQNPRMEAARREDEQ